MPFSRAGLEKGMDPGFRRDDESEGWLGRGDAGWPHLAAFEAAHNSAPLRGQRLSKPPALPEVIDFIVAG